MRIAPRAALFGALALLAACAGREDGGKVAQNVAGVFIPVLWFAMDFQDASGKEGRALSQRNGYLAQLAANRCGHTTADAAPTGASMQLATARR